MVSAYLLPVQSQAVLTPQDHKIENTFARNRTFLPVLSTIWFPLLRSLLSPSALLC